MKKNAKQLLTVLTAIVSLAGMPACQDYTPKPRGYFQIELPQPEYKPLAGFDHFSFNISDQMQTEAKNDSTASEQWFDLVYPRLNARIHCSYLPVAEGNVAFIEQESHKFVLLHTQKAHSFKEYTYANPDEQVFGSIYTLEGNVPSPIQFVLTDSTHSLFRGALYFDNTTQRDSIAPVVDYINQDIQVLIESFRWKK